MDFLISQTSKILEKSPGSQTKLYKVLTSNTSEQERSIQEMDYIKRQRESFCLNVVSTLSMLPVILITFQIKKHK
jgi:hypothetical protein